jgi:hypothetical protein
MEGRKYKCSENDPNFWKCSDNQEFVCRTHLRSSGTILCVKYVTKLIQSKCKIPDNMILLMHSLKCYIKTCRKNCNLWNSHWIGHHVVKSNRSHEFINSLNFSYQNTIISLMVSNDWYNWLPNFLTPWIECEGWLVYSRCSHLEHRASVKRFVSLQFLNLTHSVGLLGRVISSSQGR